MHDKTNIEIFFRLAHRPLRGTLRAMNDVTSDGAETAEVLETIKRIRSGDAQGWFRAWSGSGDRVTRLVFRSHQRIPKSA
jgi:hypothetical protein